METITGSRPFLSALSPGSRGTERKGLLLGVAVLGVVVALGAALGEAGLFVGLFVLAPFVPAVLGGVLATVAVGALATIAGFVSPIWDAGFGQTDYWIRGAGVMLGSGFAIVAARARHRARISSQRFAVLDAVGAIADGSLPLTETLERVVDTIVPAIADMCMIDVIHDGQIARAAVRVAGRPDFAELEERVRLRQPSVPARFVAAERAWMEIPHFRRRMDAEDVRRIAHDPDDLEFLQSLKLRSWVVAAMSARRRSLGTLSLVTSWSKRRYGPDDVRFAQALAHRIGLALDNAGLFSNLESVERRLDAVMSLLDEAVVVHDANGQLVYINSTAARWLGFPDPDEALAATQAELLDRLDVWSEDGKRMDTGFMASRVQDARLPWRGMVRIASAAERDERWVDVNSGPIDAPDGRTLYAVTTAKDVTELKRSEFVEQLLARTGELLVSSIDYRETLQGVARLAVPQLADWCSVNIPDRNGLVERVAIAHSDPGRIALVERLREEHPVHVDDGSALAEVIRTGRPRLISEPETPDEATEGQKPHLLRGVGTGSAIAAPMTAGSKVVGVLVFANELDSRRFDEADLKIALEIARRASLAVENARLAEERAEVASTLQRGLMPTELPRVRGFELATMYRAAGEVNEVGGDFYDAFEIDGGWMVTMGDVMGRGAAAASLTGLARHTIRTVGQLTGNPCLAASLVDEGLKRGADLLLCSAIILVLPNTDEDPAQIPVLVAGHPPPLRVRAGTVDAVGQTGPLLGAPDEHEWELATVELAAGDQLVLYTDGVTEARGSRERFGDERLRRSLAQATGPRAAVAAVESALDSFIAGEPEDDAALLAIIRSPDMTPPPGGATDGAAAERRGARRVSAPANRVMRSAGKPAPPNLAKHDNPSPPPNGAAYEHDH
jgi:PAS domain S-box-containing protein